MATILRSSKYVRNFAEFANKLGFSHIKGDVRVSLLYQRHSAPSAFAKSLATQVAAQHLDNESNLEITLRRLDADVKRYGRISRAKLERILTAFQTSKSVSSTQALMVIRCCGSLVPDELPEARSELVNQVWKSLENSGIQLDLSHYNALLRVYIENEYAFSPAEVLAELERKGIEPNKLTYQRLINRYCQQGDIEGASKILEFMREKGISVNENIFTALVKGHSEANDMVSAADILSVMRQAGLEPSADTYKELLCGYAKHGDIESIKSTLAECESRNVHLLDTDFLDVIFSLACNGHAAQIEWILSIMPKEVGYLPDALNHVLKLVFMKQIDAAMLVLSSIPNREKGQTGAPLIKQLAKIDLPLPTLLDFCKQIQSKGIHSRALITALESQLSQGNVEGSLVFLQALKESDTEVREHYFWPIIIAMGRSKNNTGIDDILRSMRTDYGLMISGETLRDYVIPNKTGEPDEILCELLLVGLPHLVIAQAIIQHLITQMRIKEVAAFAMQHGYHYNTAMSCRPLVVALAHTRDVTSFISVLSQIYQNRFNAKTTKNQETEVDEYILEPYIIDVATFIKEEKPEILTRVLEGLLAGGYSGISDACATTLQKIIGNRSTPELNRLINRFKTKHSGSFSVPGVGNAAIRSEISRLEASPDKLNSSEEILIGAKKRLLYLYSRIRDLPNVEKTTTELKELGVEFTDSMYRQLLDVYMNTDDLAKTEEYLEILRQNVPGYALEISRLIKYIVLLVKNDRINDAVEFLKQQESTQIKEAGKTRNGMWRLLNAVAELGNPEGVNAIFNMLVQNEYIEISGLNLGPLIKVHIVRKDLQEAMNVFEKMCEMYQHTPLKNELAKQLIQAEDSAALQRLTDLSTQVHGETNSLYDLVLSFIECDCLRQAKKILEIPDLHSKFNRLKIASKRYSEQGMTIFLERLISVIKDVPYYKAIPDFYTDLLDCYDRENNWEKGLILKKQMEEEEVEPSDLFLVTLAELLKRNNQPATFIVPSLGRDGLPKRKESQLLRPARNSSIHQQPSHGTDESSGDDNLNTGPRKSKVIYAKEESQLIESLLRNGQLHSAFEVVEALVERNLYPYHKVIRFLLREAAIAGELELLKKMINNLPESIKKSVNFDNYLCQAYVAAGKTEEFFDILEEHLETGDESGSSKVLTRLPVVGVRNILQNQPEFIERYTKVAEKHAAQGILRPINVLWLHYFINEQPEAEKIWSEHLIKSPKLMFDMILLQAQKDNNPELIKRLIKTLETAPLVDEKSKGHAHSALIKLHLLAGNYEESIDVLREVLKIMPVNNLEQNILEQVKTYLAAKGLAIPADIFPESQPTEAKQRLIT